MAGKDLFDEIIESLRAQKLFSRDAVLPGDVMKELFTDFPRTAPVREEISQAQPRIAAESSPREEPNHSAGVPAFPASTETEGRDVLPGKEVAGMDWKELSAAVSDCRKCALCRERKNVVFGDGNTEARLMFIGEGPGADEDARGLPFVGRAGELLTRMISAMGFDRKEVYIANIVKCRPPDNRAPEDPETEACLPFILRQIELISPDALVLLGATPLKALFHLSGITRLRGKFLDWNGIRTMPTFHPAYLLRNPAAKAHVWKDLQEIMKLFGKTYTSSKRS